MNFTTDFDQLWACRSSRRRPNLSPSLLAAVAAFSLTAAVGKLKAENTATALPQPVTREHFQAVLERSPFTRSLNISDSLVLSGFAKVDGSTVATLIDTTDGHSIAISESPNGQGWKLIEFRRPDDLEVAVVTVSLESGEVFRVYYDEEKVQNAARIAARQAKGQRHQIAMRTGAHTLPDSINQIEDPVKKGQAIAKYIERGGFDTAPMDAVNMALSQSNPQARGTVMSAAFGKLGGGVGGVKYESAVSRLNSLPTGRDRDFAINGLAHGLAGKDPQGALKWANSISNEGFRKVVVQNVSRRIDRQ